MNSLDRFMEFVLAFVFLLAGLGKIFSYNRKAERPEGGQAGGLMGVEYKWAALIGLFELVAALALITPVDSDRHATLVLPAAIGLALLTVGASIYRVCRHQSAVPTVVLFLLAIFVIAARCL